jgi:hypothetical protein
VTATTKTVTSANSQRKLATVQPAKHSQHSLATAQIAHSQHKTAIIALAILTLLATLTLALGALGAIGAQPAFAADGDANSGDASQGDTEANASVPVYRMYNDYTGEHLFTTDESEYNKCGTLENKQSNPNADDLYKDWRQEGRSCDGMSQGTKGIYRLYNENLGGQGKMSHHYTTDLIEANNLVNNEGWAWDNNGNPYFYSAVDEQGNPLAGASPEYRLYNGGLSAHHYTLDKVERDNLIANHGWSDENIGWYAYRVTGYFLASKSLMTAGAVAKYTDTDGKTSINSIAEPDKRALALDKAVKAAAEKDSSTTYISAKQLQADIAIMKTELKGATTNDTFAPDQTTQPTAYKYYQYMKNDSVRLYTTYGSTATDWADDTNTDGSADTAAANKYAEFRIINVGPHQYDANANTDDSTFTFHATHFLPTAYQMADDSTNLAGWGGTMVTLRNKLQPYALKTIGVIYDSDDMQAVKDDTKDGIIYSKFNSTFTSAIKPVTKSYRANYKDATSTTTSTDALWLLSYSEIASGCSDYYTYAPSANEEGTRYQYFSAVPTNGNSGNAHLTYRTRAGASAASASYGADRWWLRSPSTYYSSNFMHVNTNGDPGGSSGAHSLLYGIAPAFSM